MLWSDIKKTYHTVDNEDGSTAAVVPENLFMAILLAALTRVKVDEDWYVQKYRDIGQKIESGELKNAKIHYVKYGYFENRLPCDIDVDEKYYLSINKDVEDAINEGKIANCKAHFFDYGAREGRLPYAGFSVFSLMDYRKI